MSAVAFSTPTGPTMTVEDDTIFPQYRCGQYGPRVNVDHGQRYAEQRLMEDWERHTYKKNVDKVTGAVIEVKARCATCAL